MTTTTESLDLNDLNGIYLNNSNYNTSSFTISGTSGTDYYVSNGLIFIRTTRTINFSQSFTANVILVGGGGGGGNGTKTTSGGYGGGGGGGGTFIIKNISFSSNTNYSFTIGSSGVGGGGSGGNTSFTINSTTYTAYGGGGGINGSTGGTGGTGGTNKISGTGLPGNNGGNGGYRAGTNGSAVNSFSFNDSNFYCGGGGGGGGSYAYNGGTGNGTTTSGGTSDNTKGGGGGGGGSLNNGGNGTTSSGGNGGGGGGNIFYLGCGGGGGGGGYNTYIPINAGNGGNGGNGGVIIAIYPIHYRNDIVNYGPLTLYSSFQGSVFYNTVTSYVVLSTPLPMYFINQYTAGPVSLLLPTQSSGTLIDGTIFIVRNIYNSTKLNRVNIITGTVMNNGSAIYTSTTTPFSITNCASFVCNNGCFYLIYNI
jgi:hypothetical protein